MRRSNAVLLGTALLAACVNTPPQGDPIADRHDSADAALAVELRGMHPSAPQTCIQSYRLHDVQGEAYGATLLYRIGSRLVYRNDISAGCDGLAHGDTLVDQNYPGNRYGNTKLCRGDPLYSRTLRVAAASGSCRRGAWVAYTR